MEIIGHLFGSVGIALVIVGIIVISGLKILREYERAVIFRLGRMVRPAVRALPT